MRKLQFPGLPDFRSLDIQLRLGAILTVASFGLLWIVAAWQLDRRHPALGLADLETQMGRWLPWAEPLEQRRVHFGLTPYGTYQRYRRNITDHLSRDPLPTADGWQAVRLRDDQARLRSVHELLIDRALGDEERSDATLRELWVLLFGHEELFCTLLPA